MAAIARFLGSLRIWPGPILAMELVTLSRRTRYFALRVIYAAALFFALWFTHQTTLGNRPGDINTIAQFTAAFFGTFGVMQLMAVLLIGPALAAGTIAQERERRTMEYLYTTPLSNLEIIIGKLGGRVLQSLYLVLSGVPVLALAMLMGGIAPRAIVSLTAITLSTVLFVTTVSIAVSAWTAKARDAVIRAYLVFFCLWVLPYGFYFLLERHGFYWFEIVIKQFITTNPVVTFTMIFSGIGPGNQMANSWEPLLALMRNQLLAGGIALVLATCFMRRVHLKESGKPARKRRWRMQFHRGEIGDNPMYWKEMYAEPGSSRLGLLGYGLLSLIFIVLCGITISVYLATAGQRWTGGRDTENFCGYATGMSAFLGCCGLLLLSARASASITSERERDCWTSLISTPLEAGQIVKAKILGSIWTLRGLLPFLAVVWLPALFMRPSYFWAIAFSLLDLGILAAFVAALGVRFSLGAKSTLRAMGAAMGTAIMVGGGYMMCCCPMAGIMTVGGGGGDGIQLWAFSMTPCMPFLLLWPGSVSVAFDAMGRNTMGHGFESFMAAYIIGTAGYAFATLMITSSATAQFEEKSGRIHGRSSQSPRPPISLEDRLSASPETKKP